MDIKDLVKKAHANAKAKGFHDKDHGAIHSLMLVVSELAEACEEIRKFPDPKHWYKENGKIEGFPVELADAVIRIADMCGKYGIDLEQMIKLKMKYNEGRPHMHGKKF